MTQPPVRVILVDHAPIIGGVEHMLRELLTALDRSVIAPLVITDLHSPMRGRYGSDEIAIPLTRLKGNPFAFAALLQSSLRLARVARQAQAQIVQTFTARTHLIGTLAGLLCQTPVVWRLNDDTLPVMPARIASRIPARIISVSAHLRDHYAGMLPVTDLIPDGVPATEAWPQAQARQALGLPPDALIVTLAARIVRWKGHAVFLRALGRLAHAWPNLHGVLVGGYNSSDNVPGPLGGGAPYQRELEALVYQLNLAGRVTFTGQVPETANYFAASDVVAHTSLQPEPFGRVLIEAMWQSQPVIAADAGGPREIVRPGETGLLTPPGDDAALAEALHQLLSDHARREAMGRAARARAEAEYALPKMAQRFTQLWQDVAEN